ncbi:YggS family pyridoxal phosphate enzyme [Bacteroidia bacterium]|nr:YggS family pyridoxal phosphate enzyme [Bacteroidia bacterium]
MNIAKNLLQIKTELPETVRLLAVSKLQPESRIWAAYHKGQRIFGESRAQELLPKHANLPKDIEWHFVGHLQINKLKQIAPFIDTIQSIDSLKLLETADRAAGKFNRKINVLLQVHIAQEETKFGFSFDEIEDFFKSGLFLSFENLTFSGLMGMATLTDDREQIRKEFNSLAVLFQKIKADYFAWNDTFKELSMGMSGDYPIAVEEGCTMVRIGSKIFGAR